jgi:hypothetical protein
VLTAREYESVCERRPEVLEHIRRRHGGDFQTVAEYTAVCGARVEIIDLETIPPADVVEQLEQVGNPGDEADEELP